MPHHLAVNNEPPFDTVAAHRWFSAHCFNEAWGVPRRRAPDAGALVRIALRIFALLGDAANATRYGERCLEHSRSEPPFFLAYAHEAVARAAILSGDAARTAHHLAEARKLLPLVDDPEDHAALEKDLAGCHVREAAWVTSPDSSKA
jgi:hypothetical protein